MALKRVPSFSSRPNFPAGLQILVVDSDSSSREAVETQLKSHSYLATCCCTCGEAVEQLGTSKYDIVLAESKLVAAECDDSTRLCEAARTFPLVLMCEDSTADDVLKGIRLGACDFLEKPLSPLKLKNIWQHVVRKMMEQMHVRRTDDADTCITKSSRDQSCAIKGKSVASTPSCPKTPSPAASGADFGCSIATSISKAGDVVGESSSSETRKENCSETGNTTECSDLKSCAAKSAVSAQTPASTATAAATWGASKKKSTASATTSSVSNRPPLAIKMPAPAVTYPSGLAPFPPPMFVPGGWGQSGNPCVVGTPMMPAPPGMGVPHHHHVPYGQVPPPGYPVACMPTAFVPTPMGPSGMAFAPPPGTSCSSAAYYPHAVDASASASATFTGHVQLDLTNVSAEEPAPIGLALRKTASLLDLVSDRLGQRAC